jgi:hypothetical protein
MKRTKSLSGRRGRAGYTIGRSRFAKISAVEGLRITAAMERDFQEFDRQGLSATKRRKIIARKYGKVR